MVHAFNRHQTTDNLTRLLTSFKICCKLRVFCTWTQIKFLILFLESNLLRTGEGINRDPIFSILRSLWFLLHSLCNEIARQWPEDNQLIVSHNIQENYLFIWQINFNLTIILSNNVNNLAKRQYITSCIYIESNKCLYRKKISTYPNS